MRSPIQLLKSAWALYKNNARLLFAIFIVPALLSTGLIIWLEASMAGGSDPSADIKLALKTFAFAIPISIISLLMGIALVKAIAAPEENDVHSVYHFALRKLIPYAGLSLLSGVLIFLGLFVFIIPGIILLVWFLFAQMILILEEKGVIESLKRSREFVRGRWFKMAGRLLFLVFFSIVISVAIGFIAAFVEYPFGENVGIAVSQLGNFLLVPLSIAYMYEFYRDARGTYESQNTPQLSSEQTPA